MNALTEYQRFFYDRMAFYQRQDGLSRDEREWKALNDVAYLFLDTTGLSMASVEFNRFVKVIEAPEFQRACPLE